MGFLLGIAEAGGKERLDRLLAEFIIGDDPEARQVVLQAIDDYGLRSEPTMMAIAALQRQGRVQRALFTRLSALSSELRRQSKLPPTPAVAKPSVTTVSRTPGKPGRKMTLNWQHLFVINVVDQGEFTREEIARLIGMDDTPLPALHGMNAVDWIIDDAMRAYRFHSKYENGRYSFRSKNEWRKWQIAKWIAEGRPFPPNWEPPIMPSKALWPGYTLLP